MAVVSLTFPEPIRDRDRTAEYSGPSSALDSQLGYSDEEGSDYTVPRSADPWAMRLVFTRGLGLATYIVMIRAITLHVPSAAAAYNLKLFAPPSRRNESLLVFVAASLFSCFKTLISPSELPRFFFLFYRAISYGAEYAPYQNRRI